MTDWVLPFSELGSHRVDVTTTWARGRGERGERGEKREEEGESLRVSSTTPPPWTEEWALHALGKPQPNGRTMCVQRKTNQSGQFRLGPRRACPTAKNSRTIYAPIFVCLFSHSPLSLSLSLPPKPIKNTVPRFLKPDGPPAPSIG